MTADPQGKVTDVPAHVLRAFAEAHSNDEVRAMARELLRLRQPAATGAAVCETCGGKGGSGYATTGHLAWDRCPKCLGMLAVPERAGGEVADSDASEGAKLTAFPEAKAAEIYAVERTMHHPRRENTQWFVRKAFAAGAGYQRALSAPAAVAKAAEKPAAGDEERERVLRDLSQLSREFRANGVLGGLAAVNAAIALISTRALIDEAAALEHPGERNSVISALRKEIDQRESVYATVAPYLLERAIELLRAPASPEARTLTEKQREAVIDAAGYYTSLAADYLVWAGNEEGQTHEVYKLGAAKCEARSATLRSLLSPPQTPPSEEGSEAGRNDSRDAARYRALRATVSASEAAELEARIDAAMPYPPYQPDVAGGAS